MPNSRLNRAERPLQRRFSKWPILLAFLLLWSDSRDEGPNRVPQPSRLVTLEYEMQSEGEPLSEDLRMTGVWRVKADDPRFSALSGLAAIGEGRLLAISDWGVLIDLPVPTTARRVARVDDLPDGPGSPIFKRYRDSEALIAEQLPHGELRLQIGFEHRHSVWLYQLGSMSAERRIRLKRRDWNPNRGIEAMVEDGTGGLLILPEYGSEVLALEGEEIASFPLQGATGSIADAVRLPDGRIVVAIREAGLSGLTNRLAWLEKVGGGYLLRNFATLPLGPFDNVEGLAAEPQDGGGTTLWAVTDNDGWRRTLLIRLELEEESGRDEGRVARRSQEQ